METLLVNENNPIVKIEPYHKSFIINWLVGTRCNFNCSYCPDMWHSKNANDKTLDQLQNAWLKIIAVNKSEKQTYNISFLGGEVTLNKDFLPFLIWLQENFHSCLDNVGVVTNGTASFKYYKKLIKYCNWITFSTHSEFMKEEKFFGTLIQIAEIAKQSKCFINVNIMDEPWHKQRNTEYKKFLDNLGIESSVRPIYDFKEGKKPLPIRFKQVKLNDIITKG
jgi:organic radical activating enzyme